MRAFNLAVIFRNCRAHSSAAQLQRCSCSGASAALLHWHFHDSDITVLVHDNDGYPSNHFEANHPWTPTPGRRIVALDAQDTPPAIGPVLWNADAALSDTVIAQNRSRRLYLFSGIE